MPDLKVNLPTYSAYAQTPIYAVTDPDAGNVGIFGLLQDAVVPDATDFVYVTEISVLYRLDLISNKFYGVPDLWWVIARVNNIVDPLSGPALGQQLRIPTKSRLAAEGLFNA